MVLEMLPMVAVPYLKMARLVMVVINILQNIRFLRLVILLMILGDICMYSNPSSVSFPHWARCRENW